MRIRSQVLAVFISILALLMPMRVFAKTYGYGSYGDGTYGDPLMPAGSIDNGPGLPKPQAKSCDASAPTSAPVLFQINPAKTSMTLYFTPATNADRYFIEYGQKSDSYQYGIEIMSDGKGVVAVMINALQTNTTYYYKVRGGHGCATGNWSNELSARTGGKISYRLTALAPVVRTQVQKAITTKSVTPTIVEAPTATLAPIPEPTVPPQPKSQVSTPPPATPAQSGGLWGFIKKLFGLS